MFSALFLALKLMSAAHVTGPHCETVGPRLDGTTVRICDGRVAGYAYVGNTWSMGCTSDAECGDTDDTDGAPDVNPDPCAQW